MIKLKNIVINDNHLSCTIIPEDSRDSGYLEIDLNNNELVKTLLPKGYEWCKKHVQHAKQYLLNIIGEEKSIPREKTIMWC
jgi:hypothetical protein